MPSSKSRVEMSKPHKSSSKRKASTSVDLPPIAKPLLDSSITLPSDITTSTSVKNLDTPTENASSSAASMSSERPRKKSRHISSEPKESGIPSSPSENRDESPRATATHDDDDHFKEPSTKKRTALADEIEIDVTAPEPPSKKALRQLKKGKPLPPSKSGAESTPEPDTAKKPEAEKRSEHCVWIGNLAWTVSKADLRKFLVEYSDITDEMITRVHMPGPDDKKPANTVEKKVVGRPVHNKGFAYVDFSTAEGATMAIELSEQLLSGRRLLIKDHKSFVGRPEKTKEESRNDGKPPSKRIFLGNLRFDTTEEIVKDHFHKCGPIESVKVATFEDSGKCKGYAWAVFEELEAAEAAVRGFVRIEEEVSDASGSDSEGSQPKPKRTKMRKWWVNKMSGRPLKIEFAEDAQVRYKKRYGKDGTKNAVAAGSGPGAKEDRAPAKIVPAKVDYRQPYAARLTGGIVESTGKKTTF